ncbi:MAG TPA: Nif3-like dinuclear metal center hexameric protein [Oscillospiraceae bacterium]|nr:Nif3-like dinuclear metal center hexameric protein [Oscillospiraceae bacterium]
MKVKDILEYLNGLSPFEMCEKWDNCGFLIGDKDEKIKGVLLSVDVTEHVLESAINDGQNLIIAHHPIIFGSINSVLSNTIIYKAIKANVSVIGFHTCYDNYKRGVSYILAETLELTNITQNAENLSLFIGEKHFENAAALAKEVNKSLNTNALFIDTKYPINKVAVCGGSGGDFIDAALETGADALITGECKYHELLDAYEKNFTVITAGHFETEFPAMANLSSLLSAKFPKIDIKVNSQKPPFKRLK